MIYLSILMRCLRVLCAVTVIAYISTQSVFASLQDTNVVEQVYEQDMLGTMFPPELALPGVPPMLLATEGGGEGDVGTFRPHGQRIIRGDDGVDDRTTSEIIQRVSGGVRECSGVPPEYRADCLAQVYREAAARARGPGYASVRRELNAAASRISQVVRRNVDRSKPPQRRGGRVLRAVKRESLAAVNREVRQIVAETETRLIRSAGSSAKRKVHYQRIAQAVGTGKTILRS